jgi:hypothetical protein
LASLLFDVGDCAILAIGRTSSRRPPMMNFASSVTATCSWDSPETDRGGREVAFVGPEDFVRGDRTPSRSLAADSGTGIRCR